MPLARKTYGRKKSEVTDEESEKENIEKKSVRESKSQALQKIQKDNEVHASPNTTIKAAESVDPFDLLRASPMKQEVPFKPLSFWAKKLKDLDSKKNENEKVKKTCQLYELSETDDSVSSSESKKPKKRIKKTVDKMKRRNQKKNIPLASQFNFRNIMKAMQEKQRKEPERDNEKSLLRERIALRKLNEKLSENDKFSFDKVNSFALTSTPGQREKINMVGGSNFNFISPIVALPESFSTCDQSNLGDAVGDMKVTTNEKEKEETSLSVETFATPKRQRKKPGDEKKVIMTRSRSRVSSRDGSNESRFYDAIETVETVDSDALTSELRLDSVPESESVERSPALDSRDLALRARSISEQSELEHHLSETNIVDRTLTTNYSSCDHSENETIEECFTSASEDFGDAMQGRLTFGDRFVTNRRYRNWTNTFYNGVDESVDDDDDDDDSLFYSCLHNTRSELHFGELRAALESYNQQTHGFSPPMHDSDTSVVDETLVVQNKCDSVDETVVHCSDAENDSSVYLSTLESRSGDLTVLNRNSFAAASPGRSIKLPESPVSGCPRAERTMNLTLGGEFNPIFESTVCGSPARRPEPGPADFSVRLKPGKAWMRSASELKKTLNETSARVSQVPGRGHQTFHEEVLGMQTNFQECSSSIAKKSLETIASLTAGLSRLTLSMKSVGNRTVRVLDASSSQDKYSFRMVFEALSITGLNSDVNKTRLETTVLPTIREEKIKVEHMSARDLVLSLCKQGAPLPFEENFNKATLKKCRKIGEGVFGEVFMCGSSRVMKIIPIEGSDLVNNEPQKTFEEILSEMVIAMELSKLRDGDTNRTPGFSELTRSWCVVGTYPQHLIDLWNDFDAERGTENDSPIMFKPDQLYIVLEFANGGKDLESFVFASAKQSLSIFFQTAYSLAVAERVLEFEHRDLHWGNILIKPTKDKYFKVLLDGEEYKIPTAGVKVTIIDFTLSRITYDGCSLYNDLSVDPTLFTSTGDYQFDMYRMMRDEVENDWSVFRPKTNIFWLHYIADKMLNLVRYKSTLTKMHQVSIERLTELKASILRFADSRELLADRNLDQTLT